MAARHKSQQLAARILSFWQPWTSWTIQQLVDLLLYPFSSFNSQELGRTMNRTALDYSIGCRKEVSCGNLGLGSVPSLWTQHRWAKERGMPLPSVSWIICFIQSWVDDSNCFGFLARCSWAGTGCQRSMELVRWEPNSCGSLWINMACPSLSVVQMVVLGVFVGLDVSAAEFSMFCRSEGGLATFPTGSWYEDSFKMLQALAGCFQKWGWLCRNLVVGDFDSESWSPAAHVIRWGFDD